MALSKTLIRSARAGALAALALLGLMATAARSETSAGASAVATDTPEPGQTITNSIGMDLAFIPAGTFAMGSPLDQRGRQFDEKPRAVTLTRPFYIAGAEVTQAQWRAVMGNAPSRFEGDDRPVDSVSWNDAVAFCKRLSEMEGRTYRLPTEAEWEYACRAGSPGWFGAGDDLSALGWHMDNSADQTQPVGRKAPNAWGLRDMHGNVAEWCADFYGAEYDDDAVEDPKGPEAGSARVIRGGSWRSTERGCRSAARASAPPTYQYNYVGFRVVMEAQAGAGEE